MFYVYQYAYVFFCTIDCQYSTLNRLFGCVFLVWRHHLRKVNKSSVRSFRRFFLQFSYCLMFLNIQIHLIILKTHDQQVTLTTKKSLHIIFNTALRTSTEHEMQAECVVSVEIILVESFVADEAEVLVESQCRRVVHLRFQYNLPTNL